MYHLKKEKSEKFKKASFKKNIDSILFFNKTLTSVETKYWSTKLKIIELVWTIRRIAHLIKTSNNATILYIDHEAIIEIINQTKLNFINIDKQNLKLIRASMYLFQFRLEIRHRFEKFNVIFDVLNRLSMKKKNSKKKLDLKHYIEFLKNSKNDHIYAYAAILIEMSSFFKKKIFFEYIKEFIWQKIKKMMKNLKTRQKQINNEKFTSIIFRVQNDFIYHTKEKNKLCISIDCEKNVFELIHDWNNHVEHNRIYAKFVEFVYIPKLNRKIKQYITKMILFKIIIIDFIVIFSKSENDFVLTNTCKIFKHVNLILEIITWTTK